MMGYLRVQKSAEAYNSFLKNSPSLEEILAHDGTPQEVLQGNPSLIA